VGKVRDLRYAIRRTGSERRKVKSDGVCLHSGVTADGDDVCLHSGVTADGDDVCLHSGVTADRCLTLTTT
jgi:hypothetical protein